MLKLKGRRTADCVVGGFRANADGGIASLLLGLYNEKGMLDHVGFTSALPAGDRASLRARLDKYVGPPGFSGKAPGGPSRWTRDRSSSWTALRPELVVEVEYDQITARRFRHGTKLVRWRPDKAPSQCTMDQLRPALEPAEMKRLMAS
jgi:ATP-dependent DNA ligase